MTDFLKIITLLGRELTVEQGYKDLLEVWSR